jgi:hypothetical protein
MWRVFLGNGFKDGIVYNASEPNERLPVIRAAEQIMNRIKKHWKKSWKIARGKKSRKFCDAVNYSEIFRCR